MAEKGRCSVANDWAASSASIIPRGGMMVRRSDQFFGPTGFEPLPRYATSWSALFAMSCLVRAYYGQWGKRPAPGGPRPSQDA